MSVMFAHRLSKSRRTVNVTALTALSISMDSAPFLPELLVPTANTTTVAMYAKIVERAAQFASGAKASAKSARLT